MAFSKQDAMLAMEIAEEKLYNRDYAGAKEMALMAEKLFPKLDNLSQLVTVCEVHCSAQLMENGLYDWYKIIQVDAVSDEILIRKQYRKLALLLHPDKNKYPGAEAAFKLVGEANNTLSDRYKRKIYDVKRRHLVTAANEQQSTQMNAAHNFSSSNFNKAKQHKPQEQPQPQQHQGFTFWTACPSCRSCHQYYLNVLSSMVRCINCSMIFRADALPHMNPANMSEVRNQPRQFPDGGTTRYSTGAVRKNDRNPTPKPTMSNSSGSNNVTGQRRGKRVSADTSQPSADPSPEQNPNPSSQSKFSSDVNANSGGRDQTNNRAHVVVTSTPLRKSPSNNPDAKNNGTTEADILSPVKKARFEVKGLQYGDDGTSVSNTGTNASTNFERQATEHDRDEGKEQVEPSGSTGDKDVASQAANVGLCSDSFPKNNTGAAAALLKESQSGFKETNDREGSAERRGFNPSNGDTGRVHNRNNHTLTQRCKSPQPTAGAPLYEYPDPEFHNFDICRTPCQFQQNQIWALYSDLDTNPKYYGWVRKVESEPFKVHISWLEACSKSKVEKGWLDASLPISCGKFRVQTQSTIYDDPTYFSHTVTYHRRGKYCEILPEIGEVWAVYKNWSSGWTDHDLVKCDYDIVEIKKRRVESTVVLPMMRVPKYKSVFMPEKVDGSSSVTKEIPATQYILFSHRIPAVRLCGKHKGLWELDPASVPYTFFNRAK